MRIEQDGDPALPEREQQIAHVGPADRVERARRLVEHDEFRTGHQRDGQAEALLHALGEPAHPVAGAGGEADDAPGISRRSSAGTVGAREPDVQASTSAAVSHGW